MNKEEDRTLRSKLLELKDAVREWVSILSVKEIIENPELSQIFDNIERKIEGIEVQYV